MGYVLCVTEKPSVAKSIAEVLGAKKKKKGYLEGNGYKITWAAGHLVGLAEPEAYGFMSLKDIWNKEKPENKEKALQELPLLPDVFQLIVLENTREQFEIVKSLMNDKECDYIIDCGDAGPEGHILQWFIREKAECRKPVKRFISTSMTEEAIKNGFLDLQDIDKYKAIIVGEYCKKKADWILGVSVSRVASITYDAKVDVGRVLSPTLFFIVKRYLEVINFKVKDYYTFMADMGTFQIFWKKDNQQILKNGVDEEKRLIDRNIAESIKKNLEQLGNGTVTLCETKKKTLNRPQLYDITELERDGNRIFGYTAEEVLNTAQSLYEVHKITTYPRTDSRHITHDLVPFMKERVLQISECEMYSPICKNLLDNGLCIDEIIMDDEKVTDHHAIIVTDNIIHYNPQNLSEMENNILHLIITRMLVAFSDKYKYQETAIRISFDNGMIFTANGKIPIEYGWKDTEKQLMKKQEVEKELENTEEQKEQILPKTLSVGQTIPIKAVSIVPRKTTPPKLHTQATLLTAMENAGSTIKNGAILKGKGIGTPATRANIIKNLFDKGYATNQVKGKTKYLIPTKQGISVIKVLPPELYSPQITADWEEKIAKIVDGTLNENDFMQSFTEFINRKVIEIKENKKENVDFSVERIIVGKCPWCKQDVYKGCYTDEESKKTIINVFCSNRECKFSLWENDVIFNLRTGKKLSIEQMKELIKKKYIIVNCKSKSGSKYKAKFKLIKNEKGYAGFDISLESSKDKKKIEIY